MKTMLKQVIVGAAAMSLLAAAPAVAAPDAPSGSITLDPVIRSSDSEETARVSASTPAYGDQVSFTTTLEGKLARGSMVYVSVVCAQTDGVVVYQASAAGEYEFTLADQGVRELSWSAGTSAYCSAALLYLVPKGKAYTVESLGKTYFDVAATV